MILFIIIVGIIADAVIVLVLGRMALNKCEPEDVPETVRAVSRFAGHPDPPIQRVARRRRQLGPARGHRGGGTRFFRLAEEVPCAEVGTAGPSTNHRTGYPLPNRSLRMATSHAIWSAVGALASLPSRMTTRRMPSAICSSGFPSNWTTWSTTRASGVGGSSIRRTNQSQVPVGSM